LSYRRFKHDLYWGHRLLLLRFHRPAHGFRGNAKDLGFRAYLEAENIPPGKAYRLIRRYLRIKRIWDSVHVTNEVLEAELFPLPSPEMLGEFGAALGSAPERHPN
jgi:hypothetical protein